jgi:hypothetical protein
VLTKLYLAWAGAVTALPLIALASENFTPRLKRSAAAVATLVALAAPASAHTQWANGDPVPSWVRAICCGPNDVHHLRPDQVSLRGDGYHIEGYPEAIPESNAQPSPDGEYWAFYRAVSTDAGVSYSNVYCFFTPFQGT